MSLKSKKLSSLFSGTTVLILVAVYCVIVLMQNLPGADIQRLSLPASLSTGSLKPLAWPTTGESAIGVVGYGLIQTSGKQTLTPTASIAKLVTSLLILKKYPLSLNQSGPTITITQTDVNDYNNFVAEQGSVVKVTLGEQLSEYQALQAMLLPSANNMADTLAVWGYGSTAAYVTAANGYVKSLGLGTTSIADPSGFSPSTVSTAANLIKLGILTLDNPVLAQIVDQSSANLPIAGIVKNVNFYLGDYGIIGIKTGNTDQAGGCYLAAAKYLLSGDQSITVLAAVMAAPTLQAALNETVPLLQSVRNQIVTKVIPAGLAVEKYVTAWGQTSTIATTSAITADYLPGMSVYYSLHNNKVIFPLKSHSIAGNATFEIGIVNNFPGLTNVTAISKPSIIWRLTHPEKLF